MTRYVALHEARKFETAMGTPTNMYFGKFQELTEGPQAFRMEQSPGRTSRAHFHHVDQFQRFFGGKDTTFQRHTTGPMLLHYADADTLYGPFGSGESPYVLMTLRSSASNFLGRLPEDKDKMAHGRKKRHFQCDLRDWLVADELAEGEVRSEVLIDPKPDRLGAYAIRAVGRGASFTLPTPFCSRGQFHLVVTGEVERDRECLPELTLGWADPDDDDQAFRTGDNGARMLVLQFGAPASI